MNTVILGLSSLILSSQVHAGGIAGVRPGHFPIPANPPHAEGLNPHIVDLLPNPEPIKVNSLDLWFATGIDDLRGATETLDIRVYDFHGLFEEFKNVNAGTSFTSAVEQYLKLNFKRPIESARVASVELVLNGKSAAIVPKWDLLQFRLKLAGELPKDLKFPKVVFNASKKSQVYNVARPENMVTGIRVDVTTGVDDLRADLDVTVNSYSGLRTFTSFHVNAGAVVPASKKSVFHLPMPVPLRVGEILEINLQAFRGVKTDASWDMQTVEIYAVGPGMVPRLLVTGNPKKFTQADSLLKLRIPPQVPL